MQIASPSVCRLSFPLLSSKHLRCLYFPLSAILSPRRRFSHLLHIDVAVNTLTIHILNLDKEFICINRFVHSIVDRSYIRRRSPRAATASPQGLRSIEIEVYAYNLIETKASGTKVRDLSAG